MSKTFKFELHDINFEYPFLLTQLGFGKLSCNIYNQKSIQKLAELLNLKDIKINLVVEKL